MEGEEGTKTAGVIPALTQTNRSTGQDAVKVIKGELEQLLPDIKVFLDARTRSAALLKLHTEPL